MPLTGNFPCPAKFRVPVSLLIIRLSCVTLTRNSAYPASCLDNNDTNYEPHQQTRTPEQQHPDSGQTHTHLADGLG